MRIKEITRKSQGETKRKNKRNRDHPYSSSADAMKEGVGRKTGDSSLRYHFDTLLPPLPQLAPTFLHP